MNYVIGILIGISISSFYWWYKFSEINKEWNEWYKQYIKEKENWEIKRNTLTGKRKGGIPCK